MDVPTEQRVAILDAHREPYALQDGKVHQVIAHVADCIIVHSSSLQNPLIGRNLLEDVFLDKIQFKLCRPVTHRIRAPAADNADLESGFARVTDADAVTGMERLGLKDSACGPRNVVDASIRHNAVNIQRQELDCARATADLLRSEEDTYELQLPVH